MKKQKIQFIILAVLLVICVGGFWVIKNTEFEKEEETDEVIVTSFDKDNVTALSVSGTFNYSFEKYGDEWKETSLPENDIDEAKVDTIISNLCSLTTTETVVEEPENLSDFGLDDPVAVARLTFEDGSQQVIKAGACNEVITKFPVMVEGDQKVYMINYATVSSMLETTENFLIEEETETASENET